MAQDCHAIPYNDASPVTCLLIHGLGGNPFEMEGIAAAFTAAGFGARVICLPGHGDDSAMFHKYRFPDWLAHAEQGVTELARAGNRVILAGFSMGGTIALHMAARLPVAGAIAIAAPAYVLNIFPGPVSRCVFYARSLAFKMRRLWARYVPPSVPAESSRAISPWSGYDGPASLAQILSLRAGCAEMRRLLPRITAPLLLMHDTGDMLVPCDNAWSIAQGAIAATTTVVMTHIRETATRHHMIVTHRETAGMVAERSVSFARSLQGTSCRTSPV